MNILRKGKPKFVAMYPRYVSFIIGSKSAKDTSLLAVLCEKLRFNGMNCVYICQAKLAKETGSTQPNVSRAIRSLVQAEAIKKITNGYMVNPEFAFIGSEEERRIAMGRWYG